MKNNKAFTLIELLVVISIIGVLSSVIFVSFSGSRDKARLAKAQNFDAQVSHALGANAVGIWRFEEGGEQPLTMNPDLAMMEHFMETRPLCSLRACILEQLPSSLTGAMIMLD